MELVHLREPACPTWVTRPQGTHVNIRQSVAGWTDSEWHPRTVTITVGFDRRRLVRTPRRPRALHVSKSIRPCERAGAVYRCRVAVVARCGRCACPEHLRTAL